MSGDRPPESGPGSGPDFESRWQELADGLDDLSESLPADLRDWAQGQASGPTDIHVVWAGSDEEITDDQPGPAGPEPDQLAVDSSVTLGPRDWSPPEADDHFEPPDPPPALSGNPIIVLGWLGLLGGLALTFTWAIFPKALPVWLGQAAVVAIVFGAAILIWRMPHRRDPDDSNDGAQV